jgi:molybdopterin-guanine dinucleotide biosynthesis protein A
MIEEQDFQVNHLLKKCRSRIVPVAEDMECWHPDLFLNVNSEKDLSHIPHELGNTINEG